MPGSRSKYWLNNQKAVYLDQALVSGTNFVTALLLARTLGLEQFGLYSLFFVGIIFIHTFHHSLFSAPMMSIAPKMTSPEDRRDYFLRLNTLQTSASTLVSLVLFLTGLLICQLSPDTILDDLLLPFILCTLASSLQEWFRRYLFTENHRFEALVLDLIKSTIQIGMLAYLAYTDSLSIALAYMAMALGCTAMLFIGIFRHSLFFRTQRLNYVLKENWHQGRHLMPASLLEWVSRQGFLLMGGALLGAQAAGAIRAAQNIVGPLNIINQAIDNILPVEGTKQLAAQGWKGMCNYFRKTVTTGLFSLFVVSLLIALLSPWLMQALYGEPYAAYYPLVIWQLLSLLLGYVYKCAGSFLRVIENTRPIFNSTVVGVVTICLLITPLALALEASGVMLAKVIAETLALLLLLLGIKNEIQTSW